ncbi:MAG TPA: polysaccharide biosynthesis/export family protein [Sphingomicrobium sp.]|nr:polysaccharide biosynthesis/export family protein [Sphingomicrobium sp.]
MRSDPCRSRFLILKLVTPAAVLLATACADSPGGPIPYNVALGAPDAHSLAPLETGYKIAPMDVVTVKVFKSDDISGEYQVDLAGNISMPLVGEVPAANLTTAQLDQKLTQVLGQKYFENPDVAVGIKASTRRSVTVDGAVKQAGTFPVGGPTSLMQAVALAGGTTEDANVRRVAVFRTVGGQRQAAAFDLAAIRHGQAQDPQLYPGDIVIVDGSAIKEGFKRFTQAFPLFSIFRPF